MNARAALGLAALFLASAAAAMAFIVWRGQAMAIALDVWSFCF